MKIFERILGLTAVPNAPVKFEKLYTQILLLKIMKVYYLNDIS